MARRAGIGAVLLAAITLTVTVVPVDAPPMAHQTGVYDPTPGPRASRAPAGGMDRIDRYRGLSVVPTASPSPTPKPTPHRTPKPIPMAVFRGSISGKASWYATGKSGRYAAACFLLREAIGKGWRGSQVLISYGRRSIVVTLNDYCASKDKLIDTSDEVFNYLSNGHLSRGVLKVTVDIP